MRRHSFRSFFAFAAALLSAPYTRASLGQAHTQFVGIDHAAPGTSDTPARQERSAATMRAAVSPLAAFIDDTPAASPPRRFEPIWTGRPRRSPNRTHTLR